MKKALLFLFITLLMSGSLFSQSEPQRAASPRKPTSEGRPVYNSCSFLKMPQKTIRRGASPQKKDINYYPDSLEAFICFDKGLSSYTEDGLNVLDSVYSIAFNKDNTKYYKMTIVGYDDAESLTDANSNLARKRAVAVFDYFKDREGTDFIVKRTPSVYKHSCKGNVSYYIKYKMPFDFKWVNLNKKSFEESIIGGISVVGKVHIVIENDQEECLGEYMNYYYPSRDTNLSGKIGSIAFPKGSLESIENTMDTLDRNYTITYNEVFSFEAMTSNSYLISHNRQYLVNAGYVVVKSDHQQDYVSCENRDNITPNITLRVPIEAHQVAARLKFFVKSYKPNGAWEYKAIPTMKEKADDGKSQILVAKLTPFQLDTIYLGKRIEEKDMSEYFFPATENESGAFQAMGGWLKTYRHNKRGEMEMKKEMEMVLRKPEGGLE